MRVRMIAAVEEGFATGGSAVIREQVADATAGLVRVVHSATSQSGDTA